MRTKDIFLIGFMLFALFFGAGNLIYPPSLGIQAGTSYWLAISGFIITGVGLPILGVTAIALGGTDARGFASRVSPLFGTVFASVIYLAIAPFFGIPRAANVAYEMGVEPLFGSVTSGWVLPVFSVLFFALVYWVSLNPSKIVDRIGQWLTPILLIAIVGLCMASFLGFEAPAQSPSGDYTEGPFFSGFINGYLTMDAIAGLAFGIIVVKALKDRGVAQKRTLIKQTLKAGAVTAAGLIFVYTSIGWIGTKMASEGTFDNGGDILSNATAMLFGPNGALLLGVIVALACFTTCVGLTVANSQFFSETFQSISYQTMVRLTTLVSLLITNLGLSQIIEISVPVLSFVYPLAIVLMVLSLFDALFNSSPYVYRGALLLTFIVALYDGLNALAINVSFLEQILTPLPLFQEGLGWITLALIGAFLGWLYSLINPTPQPASKKVS
ncbi:branched-chain amino acid transporter [Pontibacillus halophilus JSM 076056 = DSM 19796]|uniref:Branched-chain amino acid transport system carrier protein n=1 Tax=Pontibacillus halophilus JSM 076056 = DSM 19796 TaxID=1385510 RepID=A0A0A5ID87_9BACI|nr:branched-chain amino acid transport system II carrier protein [Pontibacillus halophilus]KGX93802.1 branched-chain amino acid transporter [Pontibacillus halophilus JSM 076056 = DSM 19796]